MQKRSHMGTVLTLILIMIISVFGYTKIKTIEEKNDVDIFSALIEGGIDYNFNFTANDGLFVAAALSSYDHSILEVEENLQYGELVIEHYGWGYQTAFGGSISKELNHHFCSDEELGFEFGPNTIIYPSFQDSVTEIMTFKKKFKCIDKDEYVVWGDYNSAKAQQINIKFKMCENGNGIICKSESEIKDFLSGKYVILLYNQIRFATEDFFHAAAVKESRIEYIPISSQVRQIHPYKISMIELELQDYDMIMLNDITML